MKKQRITARLKELHQNDGRLGWLQSNPRQWTKDDIRRTKESLERDPDFLEDRPVLLVSCENGFIVFAGNLRCAAAKESKLKSVPAVVYEPENDEDRETIKRRSILDNGSFGQWDYDELANNWDDFPLVDFGIPAWPQEDEAQRQMKNGGGAAGGDVASAQEDDFDKNDSGILVRCKPGDIWELGDHRLMCGDSTDAGAVAMLMNGERSDMVFTDPPYGITALQWDVKIDLEKMFDNIWRACKKNAYILFTGIQPFVTDLINAGRDFFRHEIIWKKTQSTGFLQANHAPLKIHENILVFSKGKGTYNPIKTVIGEGTGRVRHQSANRAKHYHGNHESTYVDDGTRFPTSVIEFSNWNGALFGDTSRSVVHPTQKPVDLVAYLIETYSNNNDYVLDLFGGSGTTLIACEQTGRKCYMMELDPHYCDVIISRWEKFTGRKAEKLS